MIGRSRGTGRLQTVFGSARGLLSYRDRTGGQRIRRSPPYPKPEEPMVLLTLDTDQIKAYVFATSRLREIRGASALLGEINEIRIREIIGKDRVVYAGGGTVLAVVEDVKEAEALIQETERLYRRELISADVTGAWIEVADSCAFGEAVADLNYKLRARKEAKRLRRGLVTSPVLKVCESCGLYPAAHHSEADHSLICDACALKRQASRQVREAKAVPCSAHTDGALQANRQERDGKVRSRLAGLLK